MFDHVWPACVVWTRRWLSREHLELRRHPIDLSRRGQLEAEFGWLIIQHLVRSPTGEARAESPVEEIRRKVPVINPEVKGAGLMARTLYDHTAAEDDELSFALVSRHSYKGWSPLFRPLARQLRQKRC